MLYAHRLMYVCMHEMESPFQLELTKKQRIQSFYVLHVFAILQDLINAREEEKTIV